MFSLILAADAPPAPPPPPIEEKKIPPPPAPKPPAPPDEWAFPRGLALVAGIGNPEWIHAGINYRYAHLGGTLTVGTLGQANNLGLGARWFFSPRPGGPYVELGATAVQLAKLSADTPTDDIFYQKYVGVGWQVQSGGFLANLGAGLHETPPRSAAAPASVVTSGAFPHFLLEAGYGF
ncbi:MAG: hypothetical protein FJZ00_07125 [Candidatus Sericytochromatia bacterium]|uniref:Uncharacterized protein n=1 Tax=Candidatus Tanganyikabacteria bacterium TaxID=2961651 RepID=A0A938BJ22_9BACT|nr:hypothetical protein [Candidatus Tanganyikabacteria bacterium]